LRERLIRFAGRIYPASWRRRYGVEFEALLEDAGRDWRDVSDVLLGALKMQLTMWSFGRIAAGFGVAGALLWSALLFITMPDKYTSDCTLRVTKSLPSGDHQPTNDNTEDFVKSLMHRALNRNSLAGVIERQGLYQRERASETMEQVIDRMRHDVRFDRMGHSNAFHVMFRYGDAEQARRTERELISKLMEANVRIRRANPIGTNPSFAYNLEVLGPASLPKRPSSPNRYLIAAEGLAGGLFLGLLTAIIVRTRPSTDPAGNSPKSP
jgi:hypothetical protein